MDLFFKGVIRKFNELYHLNWMKTVYIAAMSVTAREFSWHLPALSITKRPFCLAQKKSLRQRFKGIRITYLKEIRFNHLAKL